MARSRGGFTARTIGMKLGNGIPSLAVWNGPALIRGGHEAVTVRSRRGHGAHPETDAAVARGGGEEGPVRGVGHAPGGGGGGGGTNDDRGGRELELDEEGGRVLVRVNGRGEGRAR
jgi:hypothetical protein